MDTYQCAQGQVLYINFELDEHSCYHRFATSTRPWPSQIPGRIRSSCEPARLLGIAGDTAPQLLRRIHHEDFAAIVLDPIYKITDGDENSAHDMGIFCNQLDRLSTQKQCAVIYCHHYSKGSQTVKKHKTGHRAQESFPVTPTPSSTCSTSKACRARRP